MEEQLSQGKNELSRLTLKDLFYKYVRFLPLFIVSVALCLFVAYVYLRYATLEYRSSGSIIIQDEKQGGGAGGDRLDALFESDNQKNIQNEIEFLQSGGMMSRVVKALDLNFIYFSKGNIKELNIYKGGPFLVEAFELTDSVNSFSMEIVFENGSNFKVDGSSIFKFGQVFRTPRGVFRLVRNGIGNIEGEYKVVWKPTGAVAGELASTLIVAPKQGTGILTLTHESTNPDLSADVINELMRQYQLATIEDKNATTQNRLDFIDSRLDTVYKDINALTANRLSLQTSRGIYSPEEQTNALLSEQQSARQVITEQGLQYKIARQIEDYLRGNINEPVPSQLVLSDPTLGALVTQFNEVQARRKEALKHAPPTNAHVQALTQNAQTLRGNILENLKNVRNAYSTAVGTYQQVAGEAQSKLSQMPQNAQELVEIDRELETKVDILNNLLVKREESAITLASTISDTKVLQEANSNKVPVKPNRRNTQLLAIFIGLLLPALFIFVLELLNDKVTTRYDIERMTAATIIGEVGHSYGKNNLVVTNNNRSVVAEQFRIIRSNMQYVLNHIDKPVVMITSSFSGEGKSFISTNVGAVMALTGKKTIILEFDIRKPKILSHLQMAKRPGLTNYVLGITKVEDLPVPVDGVPNLFVLPCGPVPPNPAELLLDPKVDELFSWLKANFDTVIVDTAPVGMVSDAMTLSKYVDATLYIVRQGHTFKKQIGMIDEFYTQGKLPKISIVLNDVKLRSGYGYYGYGRYGYGYGYGSGYFDDDDTLPPGMLSQWFGWLDTKKWNKKKRKKSVKAQ